MGYEENIKKTANTIYTFFKGKGLTDNQVYAIMGNVQLESNFDTTALNSNSGAYGLFQWLGSRKTELQKFANSKGKSSSDLNTQLEFAWEEMNTTEKATLKALNDNKNKDVETLAEIFESKFERSGGQGLSQRKQYASEWASYYSTGNETVFYSDKQLAEYNNVEFNMFGDIVKAITVLLLIVLCVVFLMLTLKGTVNKGVQDFAKDVVKDVVGKGGKK